MEVIETDIAIIGGGAAGLRAALSAAEKNPELRIALVSKVYPVRSHTVSAEGGIAGVLRDYDSFEKHCFDTIRGSDYLADQDAVEFFVKEAPREILNLEHWGCPWSREPDGRIAVRAFGGMSVKRTVFAADKTGFYMLHSLFERSLLHENIRRFDEWFVTSLLTDDHGVTGLVALNMKDGKLAAFSAKTVILATGGAGKIYAFTTNGGIKTGDGMALALRAGAPLKDMEFVQFHPTGLPRTGILITEGARGEGGYLLNKNGERFMSRYLPSKMELGPRDIISRSIISEIKAGRGFEGPHGGYVHLDIRHLGEKIINEKLPLVREISMDFANIDPIKEPIPVRPVAHYNMGGVHTDKRGATPLPGLYAAGETACVSINGANRLGSNSLAECLVFGKAAGESAAELAEKKKAHEISEATLTHEEEKVRRLFEIKGEEKTAVIRETMEKTMDANAGIERNEDGLTEARKTIETLRQRSRAIPLGNRSLIFNTELIHLLELQNMLDVALSVTTTALERKESRGAHFRTDFPERNDEKFLHHILVKKNGDRIELEKAPVTITNFKPAARVY